MITAKFSPQCKLTELEVFEFQTYKAFFEWFLKHYKKGIVYGVKDNGNTK